MIKDKEKYLTHIADKSQYAQMRKLLDKIESVCKNHEIESTDFLDPYQIKLAESILNRFDLNYYFEGGSESAERKVAVLYPEYLERESINSPVGAVKIEGLFKFNELTHKDFLGAILATGIKRDKIGDIYIGPSCAFAVVNREISSFILNNLTMIGKESVSLTEVDFSDITVSEDDFIEKTIIVSSPRLDAFISEVYGVSRAKSKSIVASNKVKLNWAPVADSSLKVSEKDMVSTRNMGRFSVIEELGTTKKGNKRFTVRLYR